MTTTRLPRSATCLMDGMADKLGVDLSAEVRSGRLSADTLQDMVESCGACIKGDACILWMVENASGASSAPDYCLNCEMLGMLARKQ